MSLLVIGINHNTASVELREKIAFGPDKLSVALIDLQLKHVARGCVILSTCNRTELYCDVKTVNKSKIINWLLCFHQLSTDELMPSMYLYEGQHAVRHLMRVACGLDSLVLGEPQILGQVKQAHADSRASQSLSPVLDKLFQKVFSVAKRVRTETDIGENAVSVAYAACTLAKHIFESLERVTVMLIGAGETIELVAKHLLSNGCHSILIANRTLQRADKLAQTLHCSARAISLSDIPDHLNQTDIVISSTASPLPIIGKGMVEQALKTRRHKPMLLVDIAVPRDIESQVGDLNDAYLYSVDDLQSIVENNMEQRKVEAIRAETIIAEECAVFMIWLRSLYAVDSIKEYRQWADDTRQELLTRSLQAMANGSDPQKVLIELSNKLTNRLVHAPTRALQLAAEHDESAKLALIRQSLGLDDPQ